MTKKYRVTLTADERLLARGKADESKIKHAHILLKADEVDRGPGWPDQRIAEALEAGSACAGALSKRVLPQR